MKMVSSNLDQTRLPWIWSDEDESWILHRALESRFPGLLPDDDGGDGTVAGGGTAGGSEYDGR